MGEEATTKTSEQQASEGEQDQRPLDEGNETSDFGARGVSEYEQQNSSVETAGWEADRTPRRNLHVKCLGCGEDYTVTDDGGSDYVACPRCNSRFDIANRSDQTRHAEALRTVGHFDLIERAGRGAYGSVWKARDRHLNRTVAIKLPRFGGLSDGEVDLLLREARAAARLQHPNIVRVHETGRDGDSLFIVSDYVRGVALSDWLTAKAASVDDSVRLVRKAALALHHAHQSGVVHRDVKPSNIIVKDDLEPVLVDFGLARADDSNETISEEGQLVGTPAYMSPEQARGEGHRADHRTDVYSLGVVLYELLTGERPFRGNAPMQIHQVLHDAPPAPRRLNSTIPRDLETIVLKCLEKEPARRYATAADLADDLQSFIDGRPVSARPASAVGRVLRWYQRNPRSLEITAGAHSVLTAVLLALWGMHGMLVVSIQGVTVPNPTRSLVEFALLVLVAYPVIIAAGLATLHARRCGLWLGGLLSLFWVIATSAGVLDQNALIMQLELIRNLRGDRYAELQLMSLLSLMAISAFALHVAALAVRIGRKGSRPGAARAPVAPSSILFFW